MSLLNHGQTHFLPNFSKSWFGDIQILLCCSNLSIGSLHVTVFKIFYLKISPKNGIIIIVKGVKNE